jgi:hypothetical protein
MTYEELHKVWMEYIQESRKNEYINKKRGDLLIVFSQAAQIAKEHPALKDVLLGYMLCIESRRIPIRAYTLADDHAVLRVNEGLSIVFRPDVVKLHSDTEFGPTVLGLEEIKSVLMVGYESRKDNVLIIHEVVEELRSWSKELESDV